MYVYPERSAYLNTIQYRCALVLNSPSPPTIQPPHCTLLLFLFLLSQILHTSPLLTPFSPPPSHPPPPGDHHPTQNPPRISPPSLLLYLVPKQLKQLKQLKLYPDHSHSDVRTVAEERSESRGWFGQWGDG